MPPQRRLGWKTPCNSEYVCSRQRAPRPFLSRTALHAWPLCAALSRGPLEGERGGPWGCDPSVAPPAPAPTASPGRDVPAGRCPGGAYLDSRLGEVDLQGQLLPRVDVRVVRLGEDPLQLFELRARERGANAPLLALLVEAAVVGEELVGN